MILSIIIVSFNTKVVLKQCLDSLLKTYRKELITNQFEIIVVDNGSTDGSWEFVRKEYPTVNLLINRSNQGFGKANNQGVKKATGKYILFLNSDTIITEHQLPNLIEYLEKYSQVGIVTCKILLPDGSLDDASHRGFPTPWRAICHFSGLGRIFPTSPFLNGYHLGFRNLDSTHEIEACAGAFLLIRRSVGDMVGWFDEDYFWYGEDLDLCYRVRQKEYKIMFLPQFTIFHYKGASSGMKKHSQHLAKLDIATRRRINKARFEVMRLFYKKHYLHKYPGWVTALVFMGITIKQKLTKIRIFSFGGSQNV